MTRKDGALMPAPRAFFMKLWVLHLRRPRVRLSGHSSHVYYYPISFAGAFPGAPASPIKNGFLGVGEDCAIPLAGYGGEPTYFTSPIVINLTNFSICWEKTNWCKLQKDLAWREIHC